MQYKRYCVNRILKKVVQTSNVFVRLIWAITPSPSDFEKSYHVLLWYCLQMTLFF